MFLEQSTFNIPEAGTLPWPHRAGQLRLVPLCQACRALFRALFSPTGSKLQWSTAISMMVFAWLFAAFWSIMPLLGWGEYDYEPLRTCCTLDYSKGDRWGLGPGPQGVVSAAQQSPAATQCRAGTRWAQPEAASSHMASHRDGQRQLLPWEKPALSLLLLPCSSVIYNLHLWGFRTCSSSWLFLWSPALMSEDGFLGLEIEHLLWLSAMLSIPRTTAWHTFSKCWI